MIDAVLRAQPLCVLTHGRVQCDAMATMGVLKHQPDLMQLSFDRMVALGAALVGAAGGGAGGEDVAGAV